jgi:beta-lactam-binding protein with PASTA domain
MVATIVVALGFFVVSACGEETKSSQPKPKCVAPNVLGLSLGAATNRIRASHCSLGRVRRARSRRVGIVIAQSQRPGRIKRAGYPVHLVVGRR